MSISLVLSGGAARGAFHLGVLCFLEEQNIQIKAYSGSSIGAIISVSHASGVSAKQQLEIFCSKQLKSIFKFNYFNKGLLKIDENHSIINDLLPIKKLQNLNKEVFVNAYDLNSKKVHYFNSGNTHKLCLASSALIPLFRPIKYENMTLIDGGLFDNMPIKPLLKSSNDIYTIDLMPSKNSFLSPSNAHKSKKTTIIKKFKKTVFKQLIQNTKFTLNHTNHYISTPQLLEYKMFSFKQLKDLFNLGYKEAQKHF